MRTDDIPRLLGRIMDIAGIAANVLLTLVCIWTGLRLWGMSSEYLTAAGGLPKPTIEYAWAAINTPALHMRLWYWFVAWSCAVFAVGAGLLSVAGAHWAWHRVREALQPTD